MNTELKSIAVSKITPSGINARSSFDKVQLQELANSIVKQGIIEPLIVRKNHKGYEIVCGHRRFAASKNLGLKTVPCLVREIADEDVITVQIIENLQRADLNAMEEAEAYQGLMQKNKYTMDIVALMVGKSLTYVTCRLRLLKLHKKIQDAIRKNEISPGHGIIISRLADLGQQIELYEEVRDYNLSIKDTEGNLQRMACNLKRANFDKTDCAKCRFNGKTQLGLFDKNTELEGSCLNPNCFKKKKLQADEKLLKKLKDSGILIADKLLPKSSEIYESSLNKVQLKKCSKCEHCYILVKYAEDHKTITRMEKYCKNLKCLSKFMGYGTTMTGSPVDRRQARKTNRVNTTRVRFWRNAVVNNMKRKQALVITADRLLEDLGCGSANELTKAFGMKPKQWGHSWNYKKLYELTEKDLTELIDKVILIKTETLMDNDLHYLSTQMGYEVNKHFVIDREYLKAMTKTDMVKLAKEIGLTECLKKNKIEISDKLKTKVISDMFFVKGFKLDSKIPKELGEKT